MKDDDGLLRALPVRPGDQAGLSSVALGAEGADGGASMAEAYCTLKSSATPLDTNVPTLV